MFAVESFKMFKFADLFAILLLDILWFVSD